MIWPFSSKKLRSKSYLCNKYSYGFRYFIRLMTLRPLKGTATTLAGVILGFNTLSGTNSQILPLKGTTSTPRHIFRGASPGDFTCTSHKWKPLLGEHFVIFPATYKHDEPVI